MHDSFSNLSFEHKLAQMLMIGFRGLDIDESAPIYRDIVDRKIGGVVLFDVDVPTHSKPRNIQSPQQLAALTTRLQSISKIPLIIAIDQEGGKVARLKPDYGFPDTVSHQWLGEQNSLSQTHAKVSDMASVLAECGINLNFAPCVDLKLNPNNPIIAGKERSFSDDLTVVFNHAVEFITAHHEKGIGCTLKHFPGHGSSKDDSHLGFVDVTHSWQRQELTPYEKLINRGIVDAVMTAHVYNANLDDDYPATLSNKIINNRLRTELGFDGLVFTDDMQMKAITAKYGLETAIEKAVNAGIDILVFGNNCEFDEDIAEMIVRIFIKLVDEKKIAESRINESLARIESFKLKLKA